MTVDEALILARHMSRIFEVVGVTSEDDADSKDFALTVLAAEVDRLRGSDAYFAGFAAQNKTLAADVERLRESEDENKELQAEVAALRRELKRIIDFRWKQEPHFKAKPEHYWYAYEVARKAIGDER